MSTLLQIELPSDDPIVHCIHQLSQKYEQVYTISSTNEWCYFTPLHAPGKATQGWKLHLSALPLHAVAMLEAVADVLAHHEIPWKVCSSIKQLIKLSSPPLPAVQTGKFITIYPQHEQQAVAIAEILHHKTCQFEGPLIPSDRRYAENSQVYYRYGAFKPQHFYDLDTAMRKFALVSPEGKYSEDKRAIGMSYPEWVTNPFPVFPTTTPTTHYGGQGLFGKDLMVRGVLRKSSKGGVYAVARGSDTFILKEARFGTCPDITGLDARDRLSNEFTILQQLAPLHIAPEPFELFAADNNLYLLMEHLVGHNLRTHIEKANYVGGHDAAHRRTLCNAVITLVSQCHAAGIILRDLTPNNILLTPDGCKLIDFELAHIATSTARPFNGFTPGYVPYSKDQKALRDTPDYDLYALGAVLFFIITGLDPYLGPDVDIQAHKQALLQVFSHESDQADLAACVEKYLTWPLTDLSIPAVFSQPIDAPRPPLTTHSPSSVKKGSLPLDWETLKHNVTALADNLYETANWQSEDYLWPEDQMKRLLHPACFQTGTAGIAYFFTEVARATQQEKYYTYARRLIDWTLAAQPFDPALTPNGLYFGYAAIPWVQLIIADELKDQSCYPSALELAKLIASAPIAQPDITHGAAGIGCMLLALYRRTGDQELLQVALQLSHRLVNEAEEDQAGNILWKVNDAHMWGFAHGTAGIASFLLALYKQVGDAQLQELVERSARTLINAALVTKDPRGLTWPQGPGSTSVIWTHWCNGAAGVGRFMVEAARTFHNQEFERVAIAAGYAVYSGRNIGSCCQCHGLAGDGDYLLHLGRSLALPEMEEAAQHLAAKLWALRIQLEDKPGALWFTENSYSPSYMTGYAGIYSFFLRLFCQDLSQPLLIFEE